jgi:hypothetical protein
VSFWQKTFATIVKSKIEKKNIESHTQMSFL